jgi:NAD-dependent deacetylase
MKYQFSKKLKERLAKRSKVSVLTGAGVSKESGIPTFRGEDGLWRNYNATELATPESFATNPSLVWEWYQWRRGLIKPIEPNPGHHAIAAMERFYENFSLITQNIDGLHAKAGNKKIFELHGNIWRVRCVEEGTILEYFDHPLEEIPPKCSCGGLLRPDVVWFGEALDSSLLTESFRIATESDLCLVIGTSGVVYPAAAIPVEAKSHGAYLVEVNPNPSNLTAMADEAIQGPSAEVLPELIEFAGIEIKY